MPVHDHEASGRDLPTQEARQGVTLGHMRYVLVIGTLAVVIIFAWIWFHGV